MGPVGQVGPRCSAHGLWDPPAWDQGGSCLGAWAGLLGQWPRAGLAKSLPRVWYTGVVRGPNLQNQNKTVRIRGKIGKIPGTVQVWGQNRQNQSKTLRNGVKRGKSEVRSRYGVKIVKIKAVFFFVFFVFGQGCVPRECYGVLRVFCFFLFFLLFWQGCVPRECYGVLRFFVFCFFWHGCVPRECYGVCVNHGL